MAEDESDLEDESHEFTVEPGEGGRLDSWLAAKAPDFSRARLQGLLKLGRVTVNGIAPEKAGVRVREGDVVAFTVPPPVPAVPEPEDIPLDIIYEDDDILVLNKPAGLVVHPAPGHLTGTLVNGLLHHCPELTGIGGVARPGIVHRLDRDTSGVMVVAKTEIAHRILVNEFSSHITVRKTYLAVLRGWPTPEEGTIETLIGRSPYDRKKMAVVERNGKNAITHWKVLEKHAPLSLVEFRIETGRTHQIRVHAAKLGHPVVGDKVYGKPADDRRLDVVPQRQLLHAFKLEIKHPITREEMEFTAPVPDDFKRVVALNP